MTSVVVTAAQPVVFAVDTSRSLRPPEVEAAGRLVSDVVAGLPGGAEVGLLAFDDAPR